MRFILRNKILIIILIISSLKGVFWMFLIPPFQTPDEQKHFSYVQYIGEQRKLPIADEKNSKDGGLSKELNVFLTAVNKEKIQFHPEVKYDINKKAYEQLFQKFDTQDKHSSGSNAATGYPPGYYVLGAIGYILFYDFPITIRFYVVRAISILISLIAIICAYLIGRKIESESYIFAATLASTTALHPMFSMLSIAVNNDILLISLSSCLMYWGLLITESMSKQKMVIGGILIALVMLAKAQGLIVSLLVLFLLFIYFIKNKYPIKKLALESLYMFIPALVLYHGWALFSWTHYGSLLGTMAHQPRVAKVVSLGSYISESLERAFNLWIVFYWANFGWLDTRFHSKWIYLVISLVMVGSIIGIIYGFCKKKDLYVLSVISLFIYFATILMLYFIELKYYLEYHTFMLQGRYALFALIPINLIIILGISYYFKRCYRYYIYYSILFFYVLLHIGSIILIYNRYY